MIVLIIYLLILPSVFAADDKNTTVNYQVDNSYIWQIHADINFGSNAGVGTTVARTAKIGQDDIGVAVTKNVIPENTSLVISLASTNTFTIVSGTASLSYDVAKTSNGSALTSSDTVLAVPAGTNTGTQPLYFTLHTSNGTAEIAGHYSGTVTYMSEIVTQQPAPGLYRSGELIMDWQDLINNGYITLDQSDNYIYGLEDKTLLIGDLVPDNEYPYANRAFYGCTNLTSVTFPEGMTYIHPRMFSDCTSLSSVNFSSTITTIDTAAFASTGLVEVILQIILKLLIMLQHSSNVFRCNR